MYSCTLNKWLYFFYIPFKIFFSRFSDEMKHFLVQLTIFCMCKCQYRSLHHAGAKKFATRRHVPFSDDLIVMAVDQRTKNHVPVDKFTISYRREWSNPVQYFNLKKDWTETTTDGPIRSSVFLISPSKSPWGTWLVSHRST